MPLTALRQARIAASVYFFIAGFCFASWTSRIPHIQQQLHLNDAQLGSILFLLPLGSILFLPVCSWLVAKYGSRNIMLAGSFIYSFLLCGIGAVQQAWQLPVVLLLFGMAGNMMNIASNTQGVNVEKMYGRFIMASFHGVWSIACFSGVGVGSLMMWLNVSPLIHFMAAAVLLVCTASYMYKYSLAADEKRQTQKKFFTLPDAPLLKLGVILFCNMCCEACMFNWSGIYFRDIVHAPKETINTGFLCFWITMAAGRLIGDRIAAQIGVRALLRNSCLLIVLGFIISIVFPNMIISSVGFMMIGFGVSPVVPMLYGLAGKSKTMPSSVAIASVSIIGFPGLMISPPLVGFIGHNLNLQWSFALMAAFGLCASLFAGMIRDENVMIKNTAD